MGSFLNIRWRYSTINIATFSHFVPIITSSGNNLLCHYIMRIPGAFVVSSRLWLIIRWIIFSMIFPIMFWFPFIKVMCLWNLSISENWWIILTDFWNNTDNFNLFIFNSWFFSVLSSYFGGVLWNVKYPSFCRYIWKSFNFFWWLLMKKKLN